MSEGTLAAGIAAFTSAIAAGLFDAWVRWLFVALCLAALAYLLTVAVVDAINRIRT
ncbi:MAG: hypothetical protein OXC00_09635 [Acidimicrobiaceae bacterium]|nr:hypothetical protein [Acidimicrobiaceae bacterium]